MSGNKNEIDCFKDINKLKSKKEQINKLITALYEDKISGIISQETFAVLTKNYEKQKQELNKQIIESEKKQNNNIEDRDTSREEFEKVMNKLLQFDEINEENKSIVFKLIDKITIGDKIIEINYKFNSAVQ